MKEFLNKNFAFLVAIFTISLIFYQRQEGCEQNNYLRSLLSAVFTSFFHFSILQNDLSEKFCTELMSREGLVIEHFHFPNRPKSSQKKQTILLKLRFSEYKQ